MEEEGPEEPEQQQQRPQHSLQPLYDHRGIARTIPSISLSRARLRRLARVLFVLCVEEADAC